MIKVGNLCKFRGYSKFSFVMEEEGNLDVWGLFYFIFIISEVNNFFYKIEYTGWLLLEVVIRAYEIYVSGYCENL